MNHSGLSHYRTWIELSKNNLKRNTGTFRKLLGGNTKFLAVIKSNAYGHGLMHVGKAISNWGIDWIGVDSISEALRLREEGIVKPILVMGYTLPENYPLAGKHKISLAISTFESLMALRKIKRKTSVHLKFDTGMHRQGFFADNAKRVIQFLHKLKYVNLEGLFTHFASAKDPLDVRDTEIQILQFQQIADTFRNAGYKPILHAAATGGAINFPKSYFDMVRIGIGLYGYWPSVETKQNFDSTLKKITPASPRGTSNKKLKLLPVLSWKTIISELKWVEKGQRIGYDYTETLTRRTRVAILPIGYWHGYWRAFSSKANVLVSGKRCKVLGRVSMDMVAIDVTAVKNPSVGREVVLLGKQGGEFISADELGEIAGTSCYEVLTRLNPLIKKYYV